MGSKKTILTQHLKQIVALASVLGSIGGLTASTASAQATVNQPSTHTVQQAGYGQSVLQGKIATALPEPVYVPQPARSSARIVPSQPAFAISPRQQATVNRRALVGQGRMISAGFRQESGQDEIQLQTPNNTGPQQEDSNNFFGENQSMPTVPRPVIPPAPDNDTPDRSEQLPGELPPDVFRNPFENERKNDQDKLGSPDKRSVEIPNETLPDNSEEQPNNNDQSSDGSSNRPHATNPFKPQSGQGSSEIHYQSGHGFNTTRSQSNVYRSPGTNDSAQPGNGVYFVPAYDPIPGTQQSTLAPPTLIQPEHHVHQAPAWPNEHAQHPQYQHPQYQHPQYQHPQYQHPQYQHPPTQFAHPQRHFAPPAVPPQDVYSSVVRPRANTNLVKGPMSSVRLDLFGKLKRDIKRDWGFGDYQTCQDIGDCSGCSDGRCGVSSDSSCPVFYFGFQGSWNDIIDVSNDSGTEVELDDGSAFFFSLGRMNGRNLRTEIELSFRNNDISSLSTSTAELPVDGELRAFSGMANLYWEFVNFPTGRFKPYIGGGVGFISLTADLSLPTGPSQSSDLSDSSSSFAYQWMAGVNFKVSNHLDLYGEYRFVDADSFGVSSDQDALSGNFGYTANSIGGGLRWKF